MENTAPVYITVLLFVRAGKEDVFHRYETAVLALLGKHHGKLHYRIRPEAGAFIDHLGEYPYEIHLVSFATTADFENYRQDNDRKQYAPLFQESVEKVILIEGHLK